MNTEILFSSKEEKWQTPDKVFTPLNEEFKFTLDPCCQHDSARCTKHFTPVEDGLKQSWENEIVFVNPPYGREITKWVEKSLFEATNNGATVVMLIPVRTDTKYFHNFIYGKAELRFIRGRIKFVNPITKKQALSAPFPSMIVIFKSKGNKICKREHKQ